MEKLIIRHLTFAYPGQDAPALRDVSLAVAAGEFVVLCGASGCGKTTLLRQCKPELAPHGSRTGEILLDGVPMEQLPRREQCARVGFVCQYPEEQIVTDKVWHELAFAPESLGWDRNTIRRRVAEMASFFGIQSWYDRRTADLSGGQKQLLNLAAVMVLQPEVLLLDEPTAQLDPIGAGEFLHALERLHRELGTTILLAEHRMEDALPLAERVAVLDSGGILCAGTVQEVGASLREKGSAMFSSMPTAMQVWAACGGGGTCPVTVRDGRRWLAEREALRPLPPEEVPQNENAPALRARELFFRYEKDGAPLLRGLNLSVKPGEIYALVGGNGTGKSTVLRLLSGELTPQRGKVTATCPVGLLPQDPRALFSHPTVEAELSELASREQWDEVLSLCGLSGLLQRHPYDLSGGEQQRLALAMLLLTKPGILLLDEPTKGLDRAFCGRLGELLQELVSRGMAVVLVSHDMDICAACAHRCGLLFHGEVVAEGTPREFFSGNHSYTTAANRMARERLPEAVTAADIIAACGGRAIPEGMMETPKRQDGDCHTGDIGHRFAMTGSDDGDCHRRQSRPRTGGTLTHYLTLLLVPLTLYLAFFAVKTTHYNLVMLLVLAECMVPFFLSFEGRRPKARELVLLAVLCALGVAGRAVFFMLPECKPVVALTILTGVALGGESGFLVGAMTMLTSNLLFGQGPWTPWQMFAMGVVGLVAGLLFRRGWSRVALCLYGVFASVVIYGGIMNPASAAIWAQSLTWEQLLAYYATGFPMDCVRAGATAVFLWLSAKPMLGKLERLKIKYGFYASRS